MRRDQNLRNLGKTAVAATIGDYLVNLDLWAIFLWVIDCLTINASIEFLQPSGFLECRQCVPSIIDNSPIWESGNQDFQVQITLSRPEDEFHYYLCLQVADSFGPHRIVAYGKQKYSCVPHSHAILALLCFWTFVPFKWVLLHAFLTEF